MKYLFETIKYFDHRNGKEKLLPILHIENQSDYGFHFVDEITNLSLEYLNDIVSSLNKVVSGQLEKYDFGFEVYSIDCGKDVCKVQNVFEGWKVECIINTKELYEMLKEWNNYLSRFNQ